MDNLQIRPERSEDYPAIYALTELAFRGKPYAGGDEQDLIERLRDQGDLVLSLVAECDGRVVGQVTFSAAIVDDQSQPWFALGPVAVLPERQSEGIGAALINKGLDEILDRGALGCILTGNPDYYRRFGFELAPDNVPSNESVEHFMLKLFERKPPQGAFAFNSAFYE